MNTQDKLKRALWLAFQASIPVGAGFFRVEAAQAATEDSLFQDYKNQHGADRIATDYVHGRMMKTSFDIIDGEVVVRPEMPRPDYQSWSGTYPTATALLQAVEKSFQ